MRSLAELPEVGGAEACKGPEVVDKVCLIVIAMPVGGFCKAGGRLVIFYDRFKAYDPRIHLGAETRKGFEAPVELFWGKAKTVCQVFHGEVALALPDGFNGPGDKRVGQFLLLKSREEEPGKDIDPLPGSTGQSYSFVQPSAFRTQEGFQGYKLFVELGGREVKQARDGMGIKGHANEVTETIHGNLSREVGVALYGRKQEVGLTYTTAEGKSDFSEAARHHVVVGVVLLRTRIPAGHPKVTDKIPELWIRRYELVFHVSWFIEVAYGLAIKRWQFRNTSLLNPIYSCFPEVLNGI